jgi:hypothetical protein
MGMSDKMTYIALGIMIVILLGVDVFLLSQMVSYKREIAIKDAIMWKLSDSQVLTSYLESNIAYSLKYDRARFNVSPIIGSDGNEINAKKLNKRPLLVFRFNEHDCRECIGFGLIKLSAFAESANHPVLVMARHNDILSFQRWGSTIESPNINVYFVPSIVEPDKVSSPYFFILHEDMTMGEFFIPDKSCPKQTDIYLEIVAGKYYNQ